MKHFKNLILPLILFFSFTSSSAQEIISGAGAFHENTSGSISWTLGETVVETFSGGSFILTQGFQQPSLEVTDVSVPENLEFKIAVYPNPVQNILHLEVVAHEGLRYVLFSVNGQVIDNNTLVNTSTQLDFEQQKPGAYFLKVLRENQEMNTFKIIKY